MFKRCVCFTWFALVALGGCAQAEETFDPMTLVTQSIDQTRGLSSYAEINMLIKRPKLATRVHSVCLDSGSRGCADPICRSGARRRQCFA